MADIEILKIFETEEEMLQSCLDQGDFPISYGHLRTFKQNISDSNTLPEISFQDTIYGDGNVVTQYAITTELAEKLINGGKTEKLTALLNAQIGNWANPYFNRKTQYYNDNFKLEEDPEKLKIIDSKVQKIEANWKIKLQIIKMFAGLGLALTVPSFQEN